MSDEKKNIKITLLGDSGVGKTCIIKKVTKDLFDEISIPTIGGSFASKTFKIDDKIYNCDFWDTAGQEIYRSMGRIFYKDCYIVCFVYDITKEETFKSLKTIWYPELKTYGEKYQVIGIAANKCDLYASEKVSEEESRQFADEIDAFYMQKKKKTGDNINLLFETLLKKFIGVDFIGIIETAKKKKGKNLKINQKEKKKGFC